MKNQPQVLFEDNHLLILNKPSGWLVQGDQSGDTSLTDWAQEYLKRKYKKPGEVFIHPTHRLDRPVSGITIFAWTSKALERMNKLFREDEVRKTYLAIVQERPEKTSDTLIHWLEKDDKKNLTHAYTKQKGKSKKAELSYQLVAVVDKYSLLKIHPKTGRPHQIRTQLAKIGSPIKGDVKYGFPSPNQDKSISLHAFGIEFIHPVKKEPLKIICKPSWPEFSTFIPEIDIKNSEHISQTD